MKKTIFIYGSRPEYSKDPEVRQKQLLLTSTEKQKLAELKIPLPIQPIVKRFVLRVITVNQRVSIDNRWARAIEPQAVGFEIQN